VRKDLTSTEAHVDAEQIRSLPTNEVHDVLTLQTGITVDRGGGIHIRGGRSSEVAYWVDGRPVTDAYDNSQGVQVSNNSLQELQVVSGTFNAEYGNAMSGIINIVTKDGGTEYTGSLNMYSGGYLTSHSATFYNLGKYRPFSTGNIEASLSGPIPLTGDVVRFFGTGRYSKSDGHLYGIRNYTTTQFFTDANRADSGQAVPMSDSRQWTGQGKLTFQFGGMMKLNLGAIGSKRDYRDYNHAYLWEPDGDVSKHDRGLDFSAQFTHTLSSNAFYTINASRSYHEYFEYLYENPLDPRYLAPEVSQTKPFEFNHAGTNNHHFNRSTTTFDFKGDMTAQVDPIHQLKFGFEGKTYRLKFDDYNVIAALDNTGQPIQPFKPSVPSDTSTARRTYDRKPYEFSTYLQDKIEYQSVIINVGLRFDYFNPNSNVLADPGDPNIFNPMNLLHAYHDLNGDGIIDNAEATPANATTLAERQKYWYTPATKKYQVSPRFGIAYPITDRGVIHFSYGHFLQIPSYTNLFDNPDWKVTTSGGTQGVFGNPDLKPQQTVMYELGLQQQLTEDLGVDVTGYYRDIRDWVTSSAPIPTVLAGVAYTTYINADYANVRGITLSMTRRLADYYQFNLSYTYQVAEGNHSSPDAQFFAQQGGASPVKELLPLDWDQTHTANLTFGVGDNTQGVFLIGRYGSGLPYTPSVRISTTTGINALGSALPTNSRTRPSNTTIDLRAFRNIAFAGKTITVSVKVFNLLDTMNELDVFGDTGEADRTIPNAVDSPDRLNTIAQYNNFPTFYSTPREVQFGVEVAF